MKLVKANGGYSIAVYQKGKKSKVKDLLLDKRVDFILPANYSEGSNLDQTVRDVICKIAMVDTLKRKSNEQIKSVTKAL